MDSELSFVSVLCVTFLVRSDGLALMPLVLVAIVTSYVLLSGIVVGARMGLFRVASRHRPDGAPRGLR